MCFTQHTLNTNSKGIACDMFIDNGRFVHYKTGVAQIDVEHSDLLELMSKIIDLHHDEGNMDTYLALMDELIDKYEKHRSSENAFMRKIKYPFADGHIAEHTRLSKEIHKLRDSAEDSFRWKLSSVAMMKEVFITHIDHYDFQIVNYLNTQRRMKDE